MFYIKCFILNVLYFFFLAKDVGMKIDLPLKPFKTFRTEKLSDITEFFNKHKNLKLIIVIIPNRTDITYGEYIVFFNTFLF